MSGIAMVGSITLVLSEEALDRLLIPLVALAAGSLLGGAFFHMLPNAIDELGNTQAIWVWFLAGFTGFFLLEQTSDTSVSTRWFFSDFFGSSMAFAAHLLRATRSARYWSPLYSVIATTAPFDVRR